MRVVRKVCITAAAVVLSMGFVGITASAASADSSWGSRGTPGGAP